MLLLAGYAPASAKPVPSRAIMRVIKPMEQLVAAVHRDQEAM